MLAILKLVQSLVKTLHSDGSPAQIAVAMALGTALGLLPLFTLTSVVVVALLFLLNVSFGAGLLGWALAIPVGFLLDPLFDAIGRWLLITSISLRPLWTSLANLPAVPLTDFNNTVVLGSLVAWVVLFVPMVLFFRWGVIRYRATLGARVTGSRLYKVIAGSKLYNLYRLFRPE